MFDFLIGPTIAPGYGYSSGGLVSLSEENQRRDWERFMEHMRKQARQYELARMFSDQFIDDVAGQRVHTRWMLG